MANNFSFLPIVALLAGCVADDPGEQCLKSFREKLKDPESGRVLSFAAPTLVYTVTNSYGERIQGKALCHELNGKWVRDEGAEYIAVLELAAKKLNESNACREAGGSAMTCSGGSRALSWSARSSVPVDQDLLLRESSNELGFR